MRNMKIIAKIYTDFKEKFGIPRQSGIVGTVGRIVFEPEYRRDEATRGIDGYSHLWLIWCFSEAEREEWSPTVRPPRLGGNKRIGVFATRSPFRPNPIGLSSVRLLGIERLEGLGLTLLVSGADILDGTPIYDIKPYLAYTDSHPDAIGGFADGVREYEVEVRMSDELANILSKEERETITELLRQDPRPSYKGECDREYGMVYGRWEVFFTAEGDAIRVTRIESKGSNLSGRC
ncbi:MAG: tRNA (N6-threonylcarbamoyladenosine(37)-N6)-methyltransferase TrmO [Clostridia bacterium]|nr:tRNA (N6-threonylcarbamoyladenosine(37)-N6)-methyltransferase TrmO [Clostridia bacterium]